MLDALLVEQCDKLLVTVYVVGVETEAVAITVITISPVTLAILILFPVTTVELISAPPIVTVVLSIW